MTRPKSDRNEAICNSFNNGQGLPAKELAKIYGVSRQRIYQIVSSGPRNGLSLPPSDDGEPSAPSCPAVEPSAMQTGGGGSFSGKWGG